MSESSEPNMRILTIDDATVRVLANRGNGEEAHLPCAKRRGLPEPKNQRDFHEIACAIARISGIGELNLYALRFLGRFTICCAESTILEVSGIPSDWASPKPFFWCVPTEIEARQSEIVASVQRQRISRPSGRAT